MNTSDLIKASNKTDDMVLLPYRTFKLRLLSGMIDSGIISIFAVISLLISKVFDNSYSYLVYMIVFSIINYAYYILMVKKYGATLGKILIRIKIVSYNEEKNVNLKMSIKRELLNILFSSLFIASLVWIFSIESRINLVLYNKYSSSNLILSIISIASSFYYLLEMITSLLNNKRRSIHDFIAGTVVKKNGDIHRFGILISIITFIFAFIAITFVTKYL